MLSFGEHTITEERIQALYYLASNLQMMEERTVVYEGFFFMANVRNGRWGLDPSSTERRKYGICLDANMLFGITLQEQLYRITCKERPSQNPNTGTVYKSYVLIDIQRINGSPANFRGGAIRRACIV